MIPPSLLWTNSYITNRFLTIPVPEIVATLIRITSPYNQCACALRSALWSLKLTESWSERLREKGTNGMWKSYNKKLMTFSLHQIMYDNLSLISSRHCTKGPEGNNWCMRVTLQVHWENRKQVFLIRYTVIEECVSRYLFHHFIWLLQCYKPCILPWPQKWLHLSISSITGTCF